MDEGKPKICEPFRDGVVGCTGCERSLVPESNMNKESSWSESNTAVYLIDFCWYFESIYICK